MGFDKLLIAQLLDWYQDYTFDKENKIEEGLFRGLFKLFVIGIPLILLGALFGLLYYLGAFISSMCLIAYLIIEFLHWFGGGHKPRQDFFPHY